MTETSDFVHVIFLPIGQSLGQSQEITLWDSLAVIDDVKAVRAHFKETHLYFTSF